VSRAKKELSAREQEFADLILLGVDPVKAAQRVGYTPDRARRSAVSLQKRPKVAAYLKKRRREISEKSVMTAEELAEFYTAVIRLPADEIYDEDGKPTPQAAKVLELGPSGFRMPSKLQASEMLRRIVGYDKEPLAIISNKINVAIFLPDNGRDKLGTEK